MARAKKDTGSDLERRVARIEFAEGAFARIQIMVPDPAGSPGKDILTDLDVVSLDFDSRLRHSVTTFECKSGRGQSQEADRLFWLAGVKSYLRADRAVLVRESVSGRGRSIARRLGIETFDKATLERRETEHAWVPGGFAHVGGSGCEALEDRAAKQLKAIGEFPPELIRFLWHDVLRAPTHVTLGQLATLGELGNRIVLPAEAGAALAGQAMIGVALAALRVASWLDSVPASDAREMIARGVSVGDPYDVRTIRLLSNADAYYRQMADKLHAEYVKHGAQRLTTELEPLAPQIADAPVWLDRFIDLSERFRANASVARHILQTLELGLFDALVGDDAWKAPAFDHLFTLEHKNLVAVTHAALEGILGEVMASHVKSISDLEFDRAASAMPDRRTPPGNHTGTPVDENEAGDAQPLFED